MQHAETAAPALVSAGHRGSGDDTWPLVITLHDRGGDGRGAVARARDLFGDAPDILAPQAARPCNPFQSNLRDAGAYEGFSWYLGDDPARPEAASFGDALAQLDGLLRVQSAPFVLCGRGQGGVLALTLSLFAPAHLLAVHASQAGLASIDGWDLPREDLAHIDFVLDDVPAMQTVNVQRELTARKARSVTSAPIASVPAGPWLQRFCAEGRAAS